MPSSHLILCHSFPSCLQSFPASGSFQMSQFFPSGSQSIGASDSASVLPSEYSRLIPFRTDCFDLYNLEESQRVFCIKIWWLQVGLFQAHSQTWAFRLQADGHCWRAEGYWKLGSQIRARGVCRSGREESAGVSHSSLCPAHSMPSGAREGPEHQTGSQELLKSMCLFFLVTGLNCLHL